MDINSLTTHTVTLEPAGYILNVITGDSDVKGATKVNDATLKIFNEHPGQKFDAICDLTHAGTTSAGSAKLYAQMLQNPQFNRLAIIYSSEITKASMMLVQLFAGIKNIRYFRDIEEAKAWFASTEK